MGYKAEGFDFANFATTELMKWLGEKNWWNGQKEAKPKKALLRKSNVQKSGSDDISDSEV